MAAAPALEGGFTLDDFTLNATADAVTCPNRSTRRISGTGSGTFGAACRCTTARRGRNLVLGPHHQLKRAHRVRATSPEHLEVYQRHRPMVERSIAWLTRGNRRVPYRG